MNAKLTIKLNKKLVKRAKQYAAKKKISLSQLIESYLQNLIVQNDDFEISPNVKSIFTGGSIPNELDYKNEYYEYLLEKHK